jgi:hypothetical protein
MKIRRLEKEFAEKKDNFCRDDQRVIESLFANIGAKQQFDYNGTLPKLLEEIDSILKLPKQSKVISAENEGQILKSNLTALSYPSEFVEKAYRVAAMMDVANKHRTFIPLRPIYIRGEPGVGKTFYVEQIAQALGLPLCTIKIKKTETAIDELMGSQWSQERGGSTPGLFAECFMSQRDGDGNEMVDKVDNPILFFDELDRVMNTPTAGPLRARLLGIFNNSENDRKIESPGLRNVVIDLSKSPIFIAANGAIGPEVGNLPPGAQPDPITMQFDPAFQSRLDTVQMNTVDTKARISIGNSWFERAKADFKIDEFDQDILKAHQQIIHSNFHAGIREMKSLVFENVAIQAARDLGWDLAAFDFLERDAEIDPRFPGKSYRLNSDSK